MSLLRVGVGSFFDDDELLPTDFFPNEPKAETWRDEERNATATTMAATRDREDMILAIVNTNKGDDDVPGRG